MRRCSTGVGSVHFKENARYPMSKEETGDEWHAQNKLGYDLSVQAGLLVSRLILFLFLFVFTYLYLLILFLASLRISKRHVVKNTSSEG